MAEPMEKATDEEIHRAIERAMNPGKAARAHRESRGAGSARLFVGNISMSADERDVHRLFVEQGFDVTDTLIPRDRQTGDPRGFAFVELANADQADKAIKLLHGFEFLGRELRVNTADERR